MSMTQESDSSEEFYDAEDQTPKANGKKKSPKILSTAVTKDDGFKFPKEAIKKPGVQEQSKVYQSQPNLAKISTDDIMEFVEPKPTGRQRFRDIRQTMQHEDDENIGNTLTPESQNSSSEGVYPQRTTHKFRIIEHDTASIQSMTSLGRVGRILAGNIDPSAISVGRESVNLLTKSSSSQLIQSQVSQISQLSETDLENQVSNKIDSLSVKTNESVESSASSTTAHHHQQQLVSDTCSASKMNFQDKKIYIEPDVIASTKLAHSKTSDNLVSSRPVVPPRKKRNPKKLSTSSSENFNPNDDLASIGGSNDDHQKDDQLVTTTSNKNYNYIVDNSDSEIDSKSIKSKPEQPTPPVTKKETAIEKLQRELENEFSNNENHNVASVSEEIGGSKTYKSASLNRIYNSLGNSTTSINSRPSPSNSAKSNSAPSRVSSIDPTQSLNLYKATRGRYVVKPQDEVTNKADGPSFDEIERIHAEIFKSTSRDRVNLSGTGTNSLGSGSRYEHFSSLKPKNSKERRKSAGDEDIIKQLNVSVRTRTDSGKQLSDIEILQQVPVKNLDTGENFPLSVIEDKLPELKEKMNPLSFHIMRLTSEVPEMDEEAGVDIPAEVPPADEDENDYEEGSRLKRKTERIRKFFRSTMTKTVDKARSIASEVSHARHKEDVADVVDVVNPEQNIKIKASNTNKGPYEFAKLQHVQDLSGEHTGAVWCMKFSSCGRLLATAGQDKYLRIWVLKDAYPFFQDMRTKYNTDQKSSPTPSQESLVSQSSSTEEAIAMATAAEKSIGPFMPKAFCTYSGHTSDLLDVSWSKNYFILSSSMDKTVRLWHISRKECLCCFQHIDFVTAIAFHPRDDRYFLSGSLDGKLRLWNIPDKKVALWNELDGQTKLITAANFCQNGKFAVVGSYDGRCIFYTTDQLKYHTQIHVRSTRGRNSTGRKISGIEPMPGEDKILVTSNDSRIRLYDLRDLNLSCKYKGYLNASSQIKASFSHDGKYIISGSENQQIYIWKTHHDYAKLSSVRRDRNDFWEGIKAHNATVTCAIFAPHPEAIIKPDPDEMSSEEAQNYTPDPLVEQHKKGCGYVLVSADFSGAIKVFINKTKPKHSSLPYTAIMD